MSIIIIMISSNCIKLYVYVIQEQQNTSWKKSRKHSLPINKDINNYSYTYCILCWWSVSVTDVILSDKRQQAKADYCKNIYSSISKNEAEIIFTLGNVKIQKKVASTEQKRSVS